MGLFDNIRGDIDDIFYKLSDNDIEDMCNINYVHQVFGTNYEKNNTSFQIEKYTSNEDSEYLILVALLYSKDLDKCSRCGLKNGMMRVVGRRSFQCSRCCYQTYPTANTIFHKTTTPLKIWFRIIVNMAVYNISISDIHRSFKICYKTSLRVYHIIKNQEFYIKFSLLENTLIYEGIKNEIYQKIKINRKALNIKLRKREADRKYYLKNRDKILDGVHQYSEKNKQVIQIKKRNYYLSNRDEINKKRKVKRSEEDYKESMSEYRRVNREKIREQNRNRNREWVCKQASQITDSYVVSQIMVSDKNKLTVSQVRGNISIIQKKKKQISISRIKRILKIINNEK